MARIVILGNGIAGVTAARHVRMRSDDPITIVSGESDHFFSRTALMYIYMGHMRYRDTKPYADDFWPRNRIDLRRAWIERVDFDARRLHAADGAVIDYDVLLLATGSVSNRFGWPGQDLPGVQGLYSLQDLEAMEDATRGIERGVVVGGGLIGVETAEMLRSRGIEACLLVRESRWMDFAFPAEESAMIEAAIRAHGVDLRLGTEIESVLAGADGRARGVRLAGSGETVDAPFVALTVGVRPNVDLLRDGPLEVDRGILADECLRTSVSDVYAAGDCVQLRDAAPGRRAIEPIWYVGRAMGEAVARTICGEPTPYVQGIWFNSAKFFDLEWQVYGHVPPQPDAGHETFWWRHAGGGPGIRLVWRRSDEALTGVQVLGTRYRHELCQAWIRAGRPVREVLADLGAANFDPELYRQHEPALVAAWNERFPDRPVELRRRRGLRGLRELLAALRAS